jgi:hypothetical protein
MAHGLFRSGVRLNGFGGALLVDGAVCVVAVGLASLTNSRPATITSLIGFELVASPLLLRDSSLGSIRRVMLDSPCCTSRRRFRAARR